MRRVLCVILLLGWLVQASHAQHATIAPGDNLVSQGIPAIPTELAESVDRYTNFRTAVLDDWHPTEQAMLINTRFGDTSQVHLVQSPGGTRRQLTFFADPATGATFEPKTGQYFVFTKAAGGNEFFQKHRYEVKASTVSLLTDGRSRNSGGVWSNSGNRLAYGSTRRSGRDVDLYVIDPTEPTSDRLVVQLSGGGWHALDWSPDDRQILASEYISINESYLWLIDSASGAKTLITPKGSTEKVAYFEAMFSKDGKGIYAVTDKDSEFRRLVYLELATKKHAVLSGKIQWDVEHVRLTRDGKRIAFLTNEAGVGTLHLLDTASGKELPIPKLPAGSVRSILWHSNGNDLGFTISSARAPTDIYSFNVNSGRVVRWTHSETGGVNTERIREPQLIQWKSFDGRAISGFLYRPSEQFAGKRPVIVTIHGGPESQFRPDFLGRANYYLNELGVALLYPNIRGSAGYGKTFLQLDNGFHREDAYRDIGALLEWIKAHPDLDGDRIMVTGGSYGGHMTLATATRYNDQIRCSVDVVGISNFVTFLEHTEGYRRDLRRAEYGDERDPAMRTFMEKTAPLTHAAEIKKPLFVVQGRNDPRVPWTESEQIVNTVRKNETPVWYLLAKDEGHGFAKKKNADFQFYATVMFVKEHLLK